MPEREESHLVPGFEAPLGHLGDILGGAQTGMLPPSLSVDYARQHDDGLRTCLSKLLQQPRPLGKNGQSWRLASLPLRLGGAGLRSAERTAQGAYWAAWADALAMLQERQPDWARRICSALEGEAEAGASCTTEAEAAGRLLDEEGWTQRPSWAALLAGARPQAQQRENQNREEEQEAEGEASWGGSAEPGEWKHGWQFSACSFRESRYREHVLLPALPPSSQAMLRSNAGPGAGYWLTALPTSTATQLQPSLFQVALRRRLRMRLLLGLRRCPGRTCGSYCDAVGDHLSACSRSGLLQSRALPLERVWRKVFCEAGARVVPQHMLRDLDTSVQAEDGRRIDVVAFDLPLHGGVPLCGDATMVSPLHADGTARRGAQDTDGLRLRAARKRKATQYPELVRGDGGRLVLLGCEVGGRWAPETLRLLRQLARHRAKQAPALLRKSAQHAWHRRWLCIISIAAQSALAASLAEPTALWRAGQQGNEPAEAEVLCAGLAAMARSRLPLR